MRVLVTRPEPDASSHQGGAGGARADAVLSPLMTIRFSRLTISGQGKVQAIIVTSRNAVRALAKSPVLQGLLELAGVRGRKGHCKRCPRSWLSRRHGGAGQCCRARRLSSPRMPLPPAGRLVHFAGYKLAFDLEGAFGDHGFRS